MGFSPKVADEVLVKCGRHCCICDVFAGLKIQLHHIIQPKDGGNDSIDNCIPLCANCHAEVKAYNPQHVLGRKYTENELKGHRAKCYAKYGTIVNNNNDTKEDEIVLNWTNSLVSEQKDDLIWGFPTLDKCSPFKRGTLTLVAGYASSGKSIYAQHIVRENLIMNQKVVYCNFKDCDDDVLNNILSATTLIGLDRIQSGSITDEEWQRVSMFLNNINIENFKIINSDPTEQISNIVLSIAKNDGIDIMVIDDFDGIMIKKDDIEEYMYRLKNIVKTSNVSVIIVSNVLQNEKRKGSRPCIEDLSNNIDRFCDYIYFIQNKNMNEENFDDYTDVEIICGKTKEIKSFRIIDAKYIDDVPDFMEIVQEKEV